MITTNSSVMNKKRESKKENNRKGIKGIKSFFLGWALDICSLLQSQCNQSCSVPLPKTATGARRLQHWLNPLLRHQLRD